MALQEHNLWAIAGLAAIKASWDIWGAQHWAKTPWAKRKAAHYAERARRKNEILPTPYRIGRAIRGLLRKPG